MRLKVLVRNVAIVVNVHLLKHTVETWFAVERFIFNLYQNFTQSFCLLITDVIPGPHCCS